MPLSPKKKEHSLLDDTATVMLVTSKADLDVKLKEEAKLDLSYAHKTDSRGSGITTRGHKQACNSIHRNIAS